MFKYYKMSYIGPNHQMYDIRQYYDMGDIRKTKPSTGVTQEDNSITGVIRKTPDFSIFSHILRTSGMEDKLAGIQADITIFVPSDDFLRKKYSPEYFSKIDRGDALKIILFSTMDRVLNKKILQSSPTSFYPTRDRSHDMFISNSKYETIIQSYAKVIHWNYKVDNGIIHVIDDLLYFSDIPGVP